MCGNESALSTSAEMYRKTRASRVVDKQSEDSFPASDPPAYNGSFIAGAPERGEVLAMTHQSRSAAHPACGAEIAQRRTASEVSRTLPPFPGMGQSSGAGGNIRASAIGAANAGEAKACPQFRNDPGVREIRIGVKAFECIGETPPQDHPHVYLELGSLGQILCPYCGTLFCFDPALGKSEAIPQVSLFAVPGYPG